MIRKGEAWGDPVRRDDRDDRDDRGGAGGTVDDDPASAPIDVRGGDAELVAAVRAHPGAVLRFHPDRASDFARVVGLTSAPGGSTVVACDAIRVRDDGMAVNAVVFGIAPDRVRWWHRRRPVIVEVDGRAVGPGRAFAVVVANGQFLRTADLVPRGHPGDGRIEVQVYSLEPRARAPMRKRLALGAHVPHPGIAESSGRRVTVQWGRDSDRRGRPWEIDGQPEGKAGGADLQVVPRALRLLV